MADADFAIYRSWKSWEQDNFYILPDEDRVYFTKELERCGIDTNKRISVFEIGFGNANFAKYCHGHGFVYAGSELDPELVARALSLKIKAFESSQRISKIAGGQLFDLVVAFDVFEHIELHDLIEMLKDAREILSEGGRIVARFPSGDSPFSAPIFNGDMTHRTLIGIGKLDQICRSAGLRIVRVHPQSIAVLGLGFGNAIRKVPVVAGRRLMAAILANLYFGRQKLVFDPNMVAVLEAEPDADGDAGGQEDQATTRRPH
ncbi:class I SAM-dependent methyltransferase (plasmid) [Mesorhizobium sp. AaZ16]|uniref:class I SAM-dependent methyltransferase n=1 Tax=Mesorhizobium sp. AaZ16 TaxID=3402289 RepID=UPI00374EE2F4